MQIVRTIVWVALLVLLLAFSFFNWKPVEVTIWDNLVLETRVPALVVVAFLLGLVPMWLIHRGNKWRLERRIAALESTARTTAMAASAPPAPLPAQPHADPRGERHDDLRDDPRIQPQEPDGPVDGAPVPRGEILG